MSDRCARHCGKVFGSSFSPLCRTVPSGPWTCTSRCSTALKKVAAFSAGVTCKVFSSSWCRNLLGYASLAQSLALFRPDRTLRFPPSLILTCAPGFVAILTAGSGIASMTRPNDRRGPSWTSGKTLAAKIGMLYVPVPAGDSNRLPALMVRPTRADDVRQLLDWTRRGPRLAIVADVAVQAEQPEGLDTFLIRY